MAWHLVGENLAFISWRVWKRGFLISLVYFSFEDVVGCVSDWVNGKELSIDQFARDKVRMVAELELLLLGGLLAPLDSPDPLGEHEPGLGQRAELVRGRGVVTSQPLKIVSELPNLRLPDILLMAMLGKVEAFVLIEHQPDPDWLVPVGSEQGRGGVQLMLGHLHQDGAVRQRQRQAAHTGVRERLKTLSLITGHLGSGLRGLWLEQVLRLVIRVIFDGREIVRIFLNGKVNIVKVLLDLRLY